MQLCGKFFRRSGLVAVSALSGVLASGLPVAGQENDPAAPVRNAILNAQDHGVDTATMWLAAAAVALMVALFMVHWSVFRKS